MVHLCSRARIVFSTYRKNILIGVYSIFVCLFVFIRGRKQVSSREKYIIYRNIYRISFSHPPTQLTYTHTRARARTRTDSSWVPATAEAENCGPFCWHPRTISFFFGGGEAPGVGQIHNFACFFCCRNYRLSIFCLPISIRVTFSQSSLHKVTLVVYSDRTGVLLVIWWISLCPDTLLRVENVV